MKILLALLALQGIAATQAASDTRSFDTGVLTPKGQEAYRSLLSIKSASGTGVGISGFSDPDAALYHLWDDPMGEQALRALLVEASPAGRFLALCGLHPLGLEQYRACRDMLADDEESVTVFPGGCVGRVSPLGEAVELYSEDMAESLRRHWEATRPARHLEPSPGYERKLSPNGRQAMEILRAASYVDGAYWVAVEEAIGPLGALYDLLDEEAAADALLDLIRSAGPAGRVYGAGGLAVACDAAIPRVLQFLESDTETVRLEVEGQFHRFSVADAAKVLLAGNGHWTHGLYQRRQQHERAREGANGASPFERTQLTPEQREAYDTLARAEAVQLGRWQELTASTRALLTIWDAEDAAGAFELLSATASPEGRLLALCGLSLLDADRARRVDLALRKSGLAVRLLGADGFDHAGMETAVASLVSDGHLPRRLRSEWSNERGGVQEDPRRELSWDGSRVPAVFPPDGRIESPYRLERCGFGVGVAHAGDELFVGASIYIDPKQSGAVFVLRPSGDGWTPEQTILPSSRTLGFGRRIAASDSILVVLRGGGTYGRGERIEGAVEVYERAGDGWSRSAAFGVGTSWIAGLAVSGETAVVAGAQSAFVLERGRVGWKRRDLTTPEGATFRSTGAAADGDRVAVGHAGGVYVYERAEDGWTNAAHLTRGEDGPLGTVSSLALEGGRLLVGDISGNGGEGSVVAFAERQGRWLATQTLRGSDSLPGDSLGSCLALDGDRLVVLGQRGPARLFALEGELWRERAKLVAGIGLAHEPVSYAAFRSSVCDLSGDRLLIGMPGWEEGDGRVVVFDVATTLDRTR